MHGAERVNDTVSDKDVSAAKVIHWLSGNRN